MRSKQVALILIGVSILGVGGAVAAQATASSHTVRGELTAGSAEAASLACNQIQVKAELWLNTDARTGPMPEVNLGSTVAEGTTLGNGCSYTLTFQESPLASLPVASLYRLSAEKPAVNGESGGGYDHNLTRPFPEQYDMNLL